MKVFQTAIGSSVTVLLLRINTAIIAITDTGKATMTASKDANTEFPKSTWLPVNILHMGRKVAVPAFIKSAQNR